MEWYKWLGIVIAALIYCSPTIALAFICHNVEKEFKG